MFFRPKTEEKDYESLYLSEKERADGNWDKYIRQVAENQNFKKRMDKEMKKYRLFANESIVKELLIVSDNLSMVLEADTGESIGVELTLKELHKTFFRNGVSPIKAFGELFDSNLMESVDTMENGPFKDGHVVIVLQEGYTLHGRLLRPAKVVICKGGDHEE